MCVHKFNYFLLVRVFIYILGKTTRLITVRGACCLFIPGINFFAWVFNVLGKIHIMLNCGPCNQQWARVRSTGVVHLCSHTKSIRGFRRFQEFGVTRFAAFCFSFNILLDRILCHGLQELAVEDMRHELDDEGRREFFEEQGGDGEGASRGGGGRYCLLMRVLACTIWCLIPAWFGVYESRSNGLRWLL